MTEQQTMNDVLETYLVPEPGASMETEPLRVMVENGIGREVSRAKFLKCLEDRAETSQAEHGFTHARGSSKSSPFGTFHGLRLRTPMEVLQDTGRVEICIFTAKPRDRKALIEGYQQHDDEFDDELGQDAVNGAGPSPSNSLPGGQEDQQPGHDEPPVPGLSVFGPTVIPSWDMSDQDIVWLPGYMNHPILLVSADQQGACPATRICGEIRVATNGRIREYLKAGTVYSGHEANVGDICVLRKKFVDKVYFTMIHLFMLFPFPLSKNITSYFSQ